MSEGRKMKNKKKTFLYHMCQPKRQPHKPSQTWKTHFFLLSQLKWLFKRSQAQSITQNATDYIIYNTIRCCLSFSFFLPFLLVTQANSLEGLHLVDLTISTRGMLLGRSEELWHFHSDKGPGLLPLPFVLLWGHAAHVVSRKHSRKRQGAAEQSKHKSFVRSEISRRPGCLCLRIYKNAAIP